MSKKFGICTLVSLMLCIAMFFPCLSAAAEEPEAENQNEISRVEINTSYSPVALMEIKYVKVKNSSSNCRINSFSWRDDKGGEIKDYFRTDDCSLVVELSADEGWVFSEELSVYVNDGKAAFALDDSRKNLRLQKNFTPMLWKPEVIKHPGGETVEAGGWASFVATAAYANEFRWSFSGPDGEKLSCTEAAGKFPGLRTDGDGLGKIKVYGIPALRRSTSLCRKQFQQPPPSGQYFCRPVRRGRS